MQQIFIMEQRLETTEMYTYLKHIQLEFPYLQYTCMTDDSVIHK